MNFTMQNQHTNIIIIPALHRPDLVKYSCINNKIQVFNRKLSSMTKALPHVVMLDMTLDKKDFTQHGLHLNSIAKEKVALLIGQQLKNLLTKQENIILSLPRIDDKNDSISPMEKDGSDVMLSLERFPNKVRASGRSKKPPVTRTDDFLWLIK